MNVVASADSDELWAWVKGTRTLQSSPAPKGQVMLTYKSWSFGFKPWALSVLCFRLKPMSFGFGWAV